MKGLAKLECLQVSKFVAGHTITCAGPGAAGQVGKQILARHKYREPAGNWTAGAICIIGIPQTCITCEVGANWVLIFYNHCKRPFDYEHHFNYKPPSSI